MDYDLKAIQCLQADLLREVIRICDKNQLTYYAAYGTALGAVRHQGFIPWDGDVDIYVPENEIDNFVQTMREQLDKRFWINFRGDGGKDRDFPRVGYAGYDTTILHVDVFRLAGAPSDKELQKKLRKKTGFLHKLNNLKQKGLKQYRNNKEKWKRGLLVSVFTWWIPLRVTTRLSDHYCKKYPFESAEIVGNGTSHAVSSLFPKRILGKGCLVPFEDFQIRLPEHYEEYLNLMYRNYKEFPPEKIRNSQLSTVYEEGFDAATGLKTLVLKPDQQRQA